MKLSAIMPVHNEEDTIEQIIPLVRSVDLGEHELELVIVDDASTDGTQEKLRAWEGEPGVKVLRHARNRGKGGAIRTGLEHVTGDLVIIQDADMEYDPSDYPRLIEPIVAGEADVIPGYLG